ncbi:MAG: lipopolysaccharide biosynthesis protein [Cetobacterium sp.]
MKNKKLIKNKERIKIKSLKIEIIINLLITLSIGILTFIVNKYFANYMGARELGLMRLFTQMIAYLSLAELGLGTASTYALYKPLAEKNFERINVVVSTIEDIYKKIALFVLIVGLVLNPIIPFFIKDSSLTKDIYLYWSLYVLNTSLSYGFAKYSVLFTANQEFEVVRIIQGISKIVSQGLQILILLKYQSFVGFISLLILENIIQYIFYKKYYKKKYLYIKKVKEREKSISKDLMNLFWHKIGALIVFNTDYIIISKFISLTMVGVYSSYMMIINIIGTLIGIVTNVITPKIGNFISKNNKENIFELWKRVNIVFIFIGFISTYMTYKLINPFIDLWLGKEYILASGTVFLIMINLFIQSTRVIVEIFKNGCGFFSDIHLPIIEGVINLILSLILVYYIGINGVIIGTIASNIIIILLIKPILVFKVCFNENWKSYLKILIEYLILGVLAIYISENLIIKFIDMKELKTWIDWIEKSIKLLLITTSVSFIIFSLNKEFRKNLKLVMK